MEAIFSGLIHSTKGSNKNEGDYGKKKKNYTHTQKILRK